MRSADLPVFFGNTTKGTAVSSADPAIVSDKPDAISVLTAMLSDNVSAA